MKPIQLHISKTKLELLNFGSSARTLVNPTVNQKRDLEVKMKQIDPKIANFKVKVAIYAHLVCLLLHPSAPYSSLKKFSQDSGKSKVATFCTVCTNRTVDEKSGKLATCREEAYFQT